MQKKFENGVRPKLEKEARKEVCVTRIEGLEEVEHERSVEQRKQEEEEGFGEKKTTRKHDPRRPSEQERIEHDMTHFPSQSWCRQCIKGRRREEGCRKTEEEERQVPQIHLDYMFMGDEKEWKTLAH